jgi:hypothetical protein
METAEQIGLDPQVVETAIQQERRAFKKERIRKAALRRRKAGFQRHLWIYLAVNAALLLTNKLTPGPWWFHWSVIGWGIGLAFHYKAVYFPGHKRFNRHLKRRHGRAGFVMCEKQFSKRESNETRKRRHHCPISHHIAFLHLGV